MSRKIISRKYVKYKSRMMSSSSDRKTAEKRRERHERKAITKNKKNFKNVWSKFLNLTMIRACKIHWQLIRVEIKCMCAKTKQKQKQKQKGVCVFSILGHWAHSCSDFNKSWKPLPQNNKKKKRNLHSEMSAIHCWSLVASLPVYLLSSCLPANYSLPC